MVLSSRVVVVFVIVFVFVFVFVWWCWCCGCSSSLLSTTIPVYVARRVGGVVVILVRLGRSIIIRLVVSGIDGRST